MDDDDETAEQLQEMLTRVRNMQSYFKVSLLIPEEPTAEDVATAANTGGPGGQDQDASRGEDVNLKTGGATENSKSHNENFVKKPNIIKQQRQPLDIWSICKCNYALMRENEELRQKISMMETKLLEYESKQEVQIEFLMELQGQVNAKDEELDTKLKEKDEEIRAVKIAFQEVSKSNDRNKRAAKELEKLLDAREDEIIKKDEWLRTRDKEINRLKVALKSSKSSLISATTDSSNSSINNKNHVVIGIYNEIGDEEAATTRRRRSTEIGDEEDLIKFENQTSNN